MEGKRNKKQKDRDVKEERTERVYDLSTPLWSRYYHKVRSSIRFPRYYKKALNW
ncbi:MAG: hypothetical protein R2815_09165 [Flavobacteriales bacterium]|nr:hypothetical protein [Flavobacteriales bacterium]